MARNVPQELARLAQEIKTIKKGQRYAHGGSIENAALEVKDDTGTVRAVIGMQPDGTVGLVAVDGPAPTAPTAPVVTSTIGGLRVVWDGTLASGQPLPADFDHVAVHVSTTAAFTPSAATYVGTITKAGEGGMLPVLPLPYVPHFVRLTAVNSSGNAGDPSEETAATPIKVDGPDLEAGSVTAGAIEAGAVTAEKLEAVLQLVTRLVAGSPTAARVELNEDGLRVYNNLGELVIRFDAEDGDAVFTGTITGSTVTGGILQTATSGERITINEAGNNKLFVYDGSTRADGSPRVVASFTPGGVGLTGPTGNVIAISPATTYPSIRWTTEAQNKWARVQVVTSADGDLDLELLNSTANGVYMGKNFTNITSRLRLLPGLDTNSALYAEVPAEYTGYLARFLRDEIYRFSVDKDGNTEIGGILTAGNIVTGTTTITPSAAHVPTSASVSFPALKGTVFRGYATANSTVPGVRTPAGAQGVTGVAVSSVTSTGMLVWVNRENTTATNINWMVIAS
jgi:hypothetical protein